jgi:fructose-1,6-bisphosphatase II
MEAPDRNLALELVRVTEAAAMASARWIGRGDKNSADKAAVDGMRAMLSTVDMDGVVVIGEGEKDQAPMLYNGERVGSGQGPKVDVAVDPLEGTRLTAEGRPNAISIIAVADRGGMYDPGPAFYMEKIAAGPAAADAIDVTASPTANLEAVARALDRPVSTLNVYVLHRDRHVGLIDELHAAGARVYLLTDGDTAPVIAAARGTSDVDLVMGIGGTPEGVIAAAAVKCLGGAIQGRLWPRDDADRAALAESGRDPAEVLTADTLARGDDLFVAATGVTSGSLLEGVRYHRGGAVTDSIVMRSRTGTWRRVMAQHSFAKLASISDVTY